MSADPPAGGAGWPYGRSTHTALMRMLHPSFGMASAARHLGSELPALERPAGVPEVERCLRLAPASCSATTVPTPLRLETAASAGTREAGC